MTSVCFVYSFNHHQAALDVREQLKLGQHAKQLLEEQLDSLEGLHEHLILDTCNRWELYGIACSEEVREKVWQLITDGFPLAPKKLECIVSEFRESQMIQHLFEVSAGVDSQMIGETEIFGQVKQAYAQALEAQSLGSTLTRVFSKAFQAAKWVRTHTSIGRGQVSIGNVSVDLANRIFGDLNNRKVLLIGTGEVGRLTAQALKNRSIGSISFASRTRENAQLLANEMGGDVVDYEDVNEHLYAYDIIVSSTAAPYFIMDRALIKKVMSRRSYRPLFLIDLAMPRDVDPLVAKVSQVFLYNLDDVSSIANENLESRSLEIDDCKKILSGKAWVTWLDVMRRQRMRMIREGIES